MSVYISPNLTKKKTDYKPSDKITIYLNYYFQGKKLRIPSEVTVLFKDWDKNWKQGRKSDPILKTDQNHVSKNILLKQKLSEVNQIIDRIKLNGQIPVIELVKNNLKSFKRKEIKKTFENLDLIFLLNEYCNYIENEITLRKGYKKSIFTSIKRINEFTQHYNKTLNYNVLVSNIDEEYQKSFLKFYSDKGDQPSTIRKRLKSLVSFVNWCGKQGYTNHKISVIPFNHNFEKEVVYLTREEVLQLYQFEEFNFSNKIHKKHTNEFFYDKLKNGKTNNYTNLEVYKDILVFGCGVGCRFGDLISLRLDNYQFSEDRSKGYFVFRMEKSRIGKQVKVPINRLTFEIWKKYSKNKKRTDYIFPRSSSGNLPTNQKMNKQIKEIGRIVGLNRLVSKPKFNVEGKIIKESDTRVPIHSVLSSHIMRRTFIREGIENKIPTHVMMSMSGHSTERVYHQYFSTTSSELDKEGRKLFSLELYQKENKKSHDQGSLENQLLELKSLFEKGLIPEDIYLKKVSRLV